MHTSRCPAKCSGCGGLTRRDFLVGASAASAAFLGGCLSPTGPEVAGRTEPAGPAARCVPKIKACFVRRKGEYGMRWPGAVYDGKAARKMYTRLISQTARKLNVKLDLRAEPIYSAAEADAWAAEAVAAKPDGLLVVLLDRQQHAWPTANKAIDTKIPTVIFSPVGSSFTTNTAAPSRKPGCFICSTDDFDEVVYGMKMLHARAKLRATRCLVIRGRQRAERTMRDLGIQLRYVPARDFLDEYRKTPDSDEMLAVAADYMSRARRQRGATRRDVINGVKSYVVARKLLQREQCDAITMDCLGALGRTKVSLPCIAWSRMNDDGVPAACEADLGAVATHAIVQYLFDRPGFQQDPVAETARGAIIGAHCCCATKLKGFSQPPEPFDLVHHHGNRDAVPRTIWRVGQRVTSADVLPGRRDGTTKMLISAGEVLANVSVPPAGGCVVSVMVRFDGVTDVLAYPGFHQIFFYGDFKRQLASFCRLMGIEPVVV
ncbi:MAG: hypothetical protein AMK72_13105 [Planctomycetes bacterium SM23_25]|nr:MAG: hypothetical protein AMK72_13105 [Planctomycetes bacterium SM23_25]